MRTSGSLLVGQHQPQRVYHAGYAAKNGKDDVDPEVCGHADLEERRHWWQNNGQDDLHYLHAIVLSVAASCLVKRSIEHNR